MTLPQNVKAEVLELLGKLRDEQLDPAGRERLEILVCESEEARRLYLRYIELCASLHWVRREQQGASLIPEIAGSTLTNEEERPKPIDQPPYTGEPAASPTTLLPEYDLPWEKPRPKVVIETSPPRPIPWYSVNSPIGLPLISYTLGAIITLIAISIGAVVQITHSYEIAARQAATSEEESGGGSSGGGGLSGDLATAEKAKPKKAESPVVGHISGMADCRWADPSLKPLAPRVRQGAKFALASGLMEITYTTGAKVILQGPCTYEVESPSGGYLALGKLTAKVASGRQPVASAESHAANHKSAIINHKSHSPLTPSHLPLFTVRTPTALITDLGTEFGIEVFDTGDSHAHVFQGRIEVRLTGDVSGETGRVVVLGENQSARVERSGAGKAGGIIHLLSDGAKPSGFVRTMPPPKAIQESEAYEKLVLSLQPVVYYRMEQPKDEKDRFVVFDSSGGGHHGEFRSDSGQDVSPYVRGRFGDALRLRGPWVHDRVIVFDYPKAAGDQLTVSAWVMVTSRLEWAMIASNWGVPRKGKGADDNTGQFHFGLCRTEGDLAVRLTQRTGECLFFREGGLRALPLDTWQHVAFVVDGSTLRLFRNGEEVGTIACQGILFPPPVSALGIGCRMNAAETDAFMEKQAQQFQYYWQGLIDELAIFNSALSHEQIKQLYFGKSPVQN